MSRKSRTFFRIIKTGVINFGRNIALAIAAIAVMVVTLTIILFSVVANATFSNTIQQLTDKINISVYLSDATTAEQRNAFIAELRKLPNVKKVTYVSKEQALSSFRESNDNDPNLQKAINETGNILPASVAIYPQDVNKIQNIKDFIDRPENIKLQDKQYPTSYSGDRKTAVDNITQATQILRRVGIGAVGLFALVSVLIIFNTIQMAIFNRRDEIQIMRLLGANTWFIRGPFVIESILYGAISALLSIGILRAAFSATSTALQATSFGLLDIAYANNYFLGHFWRLLTLQLSVGILIGAVSSIIATRRYLKFKVSK